MSNLIVLSPNPEWVKTLPNAKLPDRTDFRRFGDDTQARVAAWSRAVKESGRLRDEIALWAAGRLPLEVQALV